MFSFYPKNGRTGSRKISMTQAWLVVESCPTPLWVMFLIFCQLVYDILLSFEWSDFDLKYLVTVMLKGQPPKLKASV